jgi:anti-anti-sigma factor
MVRTIRVPGPTLDGQAGHALRVLVEDAQRRGARVVALDFADVRRIDTRGICALVAQHRRLPEGSRIVVCHLDDYVRDILEITQLVRIFDVYESDEAVELALSA